MRRYNVVSGVLFVLPIINFALAAPALVQEKRHAFVDVVHKLDDAEIIVLGKRVEDPLDLMWNKYFEKMWGKPEVSSATHAPSSSAPSTPGHGSTNVIEEPAPNSASTAANPGHALVEQTSPSSVVSPMPEWEGIVPAGPDDQLHGPPPTPSSSNIGSDNEITEITETHSPQSNPKLNPSPAANSDSDFDWEHWQNKVDTPPRPPTPAKPVNWKYWINPLNFMSPLSPETTLSTLKPSTKWNTKPSSSSSSSSGWKSFLKKLKNPLAKPSKSGQLDPGPSNPGSSSTKFAPRMPSPKAGPPTIRSPKIPPPNIATQLSSADLPGADSQALDPQADAYASKGDAKTLRRISGASRDVENAAQREVGSAGRSLESA